MNKAEALDILRRYQPLPPDRHLSEEVLSEFDQAREYFVAHPDPEAVPLFLNAFGDGSGFGVYQLVEDAIGPLSSEDVLPHLVDALQSARAWKRYWAAQIATSFPDPVLIPVLAPLLASDDSDCREAAATALMFIDAPEVPTLIRAAYTRTGDSFLKEQMDDL